MKTFATIEEQNKAIDDFDERSGNAADLEEVMNAEIKPLEETLPVDGSSEIVTPVEPKPDSSLVPEKVADQLEPEKTKDPEVNEVAILKEQLEEKNKYIKENFANIDNFRTLESKVSKMEKTYSEQAPQSQQQKVELRQSKLANLQTRRKNLLAKFTNPEDQLDAEFVGEMNEIQSGLMEEVGVNQHNLSVVQAQAKQATEKADSYIEIREKDAQVERQKKADLSEVKAIEDFSKSNPQFKLSKPFKEVNQDYAKYQENVSRVYLGREPENKAEVDESMNQLKRRSPNLTAKLRMAGIETEPSVDIKKYLGLCEIWDHWSGIRKDSVTGDYNRDKDGSVIPLMRYEPSIGKYVPDRYPTVEAAFNDRAAKEGFYVRQIVNAKIEGGKQAIGAMNKRDSGATELGVTETSGGQLQAAEEMWKSFNEIDEIQAMMQARDGNPELLNEYNRLAKGIGLPTVPDPLAI